MDVISSDTALSDTPIDYPGTYGIPIETHPLTLITLDRATGERAETSYGSQEFCDSINVAVDSLGYAGDKAVNALLQGLTVYTPEHIRFIKELHSHPTPYFYFYRTSLEGGVGQSLVHVDGSGVLVVD